MKQIGVMLLVLSSILGYGQEMQKKLEISVAANFTVAGLGDIYNNSDIRFTNPDLINKNELSTLNGLKTALNYYLNPQYSLGAGIGISSINYSQEFTFSQDPHIEGILTGEQYTLPVFLQFKAFLNKKMNKPYTLLQLGVYPDITNKWSKGHFVELGVGYQIRYLKKRKIGFRLSYNHSWYKNNLPYSDRSLSSKEIYFCDSRFKNLLFNIDFYL